MKTPRMVCYCHSCGREVECPPGKPPCEGFKGWLTVACWKGAKAVEHYNFCSFGCLKSWVDTQVPKVPEVFLQSFKEKKKRGRPRLS